VLTARVGSEKREFAGFAFSSFPSLNFLAASLYSSPDLTALHQSTPRDQLPIVSRTHLPLIDLLSNLETTNNAIPPQLERLSKYYCIGPDIARALKGLESRYQLASLFPFPFLSLVIASPPPLIETVQCCHSPDALHSKL